MYIFISVAIRWILQPSQSLGLSVSGTSAQELSCPLPGFLRFPLVFLFAHLTGILLSQDNTSHGYAQSLLWLCQPPRQQNSG